MKNKIIKKVLFIILGILSFITISTVIVGLIMSFKKPSFVGGEDGDWIGYFGGVVGVVGAYYIFNIQQNQDKKQYRKQNIDNTFFNLLDMFNNLLEKKVKPLDELYKNLNQEKANQDEIVRNREEKKYIRNNINLINDTLDAISMESKYGILLDINKLKINTTSDCQGDFNNQEYFRELVFDYGVTLNTSTLELAMAKPRIVNLYYSERSYWGALISEKINATITGSKDRTIQIIAKKSGKTVDKVKKDLSLLNQVKLTEGEFLIYEELENCYRQLLEQLIPVMARMNSESQIEIDINYSFSEKKTLIVTHMNESLPELGNLFRFFYRIIKYLNDNTDDIETKQMREYIGILRALIDEKALVLIAYNAIYMEVGTNLKKNLSECTFFESKTLLSETSLLWGRIDKDDIVKLLTI